MFFFGSVVVIMSPFPNRILYIHNNTWLILDYICGGTSQKLVAFPISELFVRYLQILQPRLYPQNCISTAEKPIMAKDGNVYQVHKLAAVPEGADKVKVKLI